MTFHVQADFGFPLDAFELKNEIRNIGFLLDAFDLENKIKDMLASYWMFCSEVRNVGFLLDALY